MIIIKCTNSNIIFIVVILLLELLLYDYYYLLFVGYGGQSRFSKETEHTQYHGFVSQAYNKSKPAPSSFALCMYFNLTTCLYIRITMCYA